MAKHRMARGGKIGKYNDPEFIHNWSADRSLKIRSPKGFRHTATSRAQVADRIAKALKKNFSGLLLTKKRMSKVMPKKHRKSHHKK